jgi:tyrosyl-tRNA synthetase
MKLSQELEKRGFVHQFVGDSVAAIFDGAPRVVYHGIDPSADSAHVGNFVSWILLKHLVNHGHKVIFLVGGGTGMIGDPKPDVERPLYSKTVVEENVLKLKTQAEKIFGTEEVVFVNNADWLTDIKLIDFLREIGKHFTVNELIKKDAIATRLGREDGISYTEFAYPLLQGYDYLQLHINYQCDVQISGSDQWGNIVAGVDLIRRVTGDKVYALTTPLIIDKTTGKKFGKSEGNAIWLDPEKTTPYQFYQFWLNVADENVIDYLKVFTFLSLEDIETIEREAQTNPSARVAQRALAHAVTTIVHDAEVATNVESVSQVLFGNSTIATLGEVERTILLDNAPTYQTTVLTPLVEVLVESGLAASKREARTFITGGAVTINETKITDCEAVITKELFTQSIAILRRGKKQMMVLVQK